MNTSGAASSPFQGPAAAATFLLLPFLALSLTGTLETDAPGVLACLGLAFAVYWLGCVEHRFRLSETQVLLVGLGARALLLPMPPSDDMYRYLWEGKILGHGFNPFLMAPDHPDLAFLRDASWPLINHPDLPTVYPPLAQTLFWLLAKAGSSWPVFKTAFLAFDALGFFAMRSLLRSRVPGASEGLPAVPDNRLLAIYFLNPLLIFEIAGRGHFDSLPVFLNLLFLAGLYSPSRFRRAMAPAYLGLGAMAKITSLALAPLLLSALGWKRALAWGAILGAALGGSLWSVGAFGTLGRFAAGFRYNAAVPSLIDSALPFLSAGTRRGLALGLFAVCVGACLILLRRAAPERRALWYMGLLLLFSPTLHPWYLLWALPFAALCLSRPWLLLTGTALFSYEIYTRAHAAGQWHENPWMRLPEFLPPLFLYLCLRWKTWKRA